MFECQFFVFKPFRVRSNKFVSYFISFNFLNLTVCPFFQVVFIYSFALLLI